MQNLGSIITDAVSEAPQATGWREQAVEEYGRSLPGRIADLRVQLAARLLILTGRRIRLEDIYTDTNGRLAATSVDHMMFRLFGRRLVLARSCAYCGIGRFESPEINDLADLGYALSFWRPMHEDCEDHDSEEDLAHW
jgi:hypothetical protein